MNYDFRNLSLTQKTILAAGGYRLGEKLEGRPHRFPTECALQTLVKRGFLRESEGGAFAVPSDVAAAFRDHRAFVLSRRAFQDAKRGQA